MASTTITITLTEEEQQVFLKYCFLRVFKCSIALIEELEIPESIDSQMLKDKIETNLEDIDAIKDHVERVRSKITEAVRIEAAKK